jgi:hypothetical protein
MQTRDEYVAGLKKQLDGWNAEIEILEARARKSKEDAKVKYGELLGDLHTRRLQGRKKLAALKAARGDSWEALKADTQKVWEALTDSVNVFKAHLE